MGFQYSDDVDTIEKSAHDVIRRANGLVMSLSSDNMSVMYTSRNDSCFGEFIQIIYLLIGHYFPLTVNIMLKLTRTHISSVVLDSDTNAFFLSKFEAHLLQLKWFLIKLKRK